jgi:hypothetical protein
MADIRGLMGVKPGEGGNEGGGLVLALVISVASCVMFGLSMVWVNNERTDMGYTVREIRKQVETREAYQARLEVERDRLLDPRVLDRKAREFGLRDARPGQIRRMDGNGGQ